MQTLYAIVAQAVELQQGKEIQLPLILIKRLKKKFKKMLVVIQEKNLMNILLIHFMIIKM